MTVLVLGSGSPRRREILTSVGVPHVVRVASANEDVNAGEAPLAYLERVVLAKLEAVRAFSPDERGGDRAVILVADTTVIDGGDVLGKPADEAAARAMIARLAGKTHEVATRFAFGGGERGAPPLHAETVVTRVTFRALGRDEIDAYAASGEGLDKAGGYAVQGRAAAFVSRIEGSYTNVVGLPACEVVVALRRLSPP